MSKKCLVLRFTLVFIIVSIIPTSIYYNIENRILSEKITELQKEVTELKTANLRTILGITEIPPHPHQIFGSKDSHLLITGWVFNSGGIKASNAGVRVLAFNETDAVLLNVTVPIVPGRTFSTALNESLIPEVPYWLPDAIPLSELEYGNVLSQENVTVRFSIFHEGIFPSSTRYEIIPIWENKERIVTK